MEAAPPAPEYICSPDECKPAPPLAAIQFWGEPIYSNETSFYVLQDGYFNLNPIQFGLEFVGPQTWRAGHKYEFISTLSQTLELIDKLGSDNLGVLLDCWQWYTSGGTVAELDALDGDQIVYAHINDAPVGRDVFAQIDEERMLPGVTGVIDIENFLKALNRHEFNGPVSVEPYNAELTALAPIERARRARSSAEAVFRKARIAIA